MNLFNESLNITKTNHRTKKVNAKAPNYVHHIWKEKKALTFNKFQFSWHNIWSICDDCKTNLCSYIIFFLICICFCLQVSLCFLVLLPSLAICSRDCFSYMHTASLSGQISRWILLKHQQAFSIPVRRIL